MGAIVVQQDDQTVSEPLKPQGPLALTRSMSEMTALPRFPETKKIGSTRVAPLAESAESVMVGATGSIMALLDSETRHNHFYSQRYVPQAPQRHSQSSWWKDLKQLGSRRPAAKKWEPISEEESRSKKGVSFWKKFLPKGKKDKSSKPQARDNTDLKKDGFRSAKDFDFWHQQSSNPSNKTAIKSQSVRNGFSTDSSALQRQSSAPLWQRRNIAPVSGLDSSRLKMNRSARVGSATAVAMAAAVQESIPE